MRLTVLQARKGVRDWRQKQGNQIVHRIRTGTPIGLNVCLRRRNQSEEHRAFRGINWRRDATGSTTGIIKPIVADADVDAVGLRLQLERVASAIQPREGEAIAIINVVQGRLRAGNGEEAGGRIEIPGQWQWQRWCNAGEIARAANVE